MAVLLLLSLQEFVFDASVLSAGHEPVLSFEVYSRASMVLLPDELLFFAYLPLDEDSGLQDLQEKQQQRQQQQHKQRAIDTQQAAAAAAAAAAESSAEDLSVLAAQAAACRHSSTTRVPGASAARAAAQEAAAAASSAALRRSRGTPGFSSTVQVHRLALLPAQGQHGSGSSGGGGLLSTARSGTLGRSGSKGGVPAPSKAFSKTRLKRSTHVRSAGELEVEVWWVQQPSLGNAGEWWE
jgi:hypothetical protein